MAVPATVQAAGIAQEGSAGAAVEQEASATDEREIGDGRRTLGRLPASLGRGFVGVFSRQSLMPLLGGLVATGGATLLDDGLANPDGADDNLGRLGAGFGNPAWVAVFAAGMFVGGRIDDNQLFRDATYDVFVAAGVNMAYTYALKLTVSRTRPNGSNDQSFPSGHTSNAFAWATVLERHYGVEVGIPMYVLAALIGTSRVTGGKHYLSDVVAGATIGFIVGRSVTRQNDVPLDAPRWSVLPAVGPSGQRGLVVTFQF